MMRFTQKEARTLSEAIDGWERGGEIDGETASRLRGSYSVLGTDWKRAARYSFVVAVVCGVIGFGAVVADDILVERIMESVGAVSLLFAVSSGIVFAFGRMRMKNCPERVFGNEAVLLCGVLLAAASLAFLNRALTDNGWMDRDSVLFLAAAVLYGVIGMAFRSVLVWVFAILSLGSWLGMETGYLSGWGAYYLGMNQPFRFVLFGAALLLVSFLKIRFRRVDFIMGLLYLFVSLWILSIFGNGDFEKIRRTDGMLFWSVAFGVAALAAIAHGVRCGDRASRGFGVTFLLINLYTKYFEYCWDEMHKALFFFVLAASFWLIGGKAEALWNLEFLRKSKPD